MRTLNTLPSGSDGKERVCHAGDPGLIPGLGRSPGRKWLPTPVFLPGESHGQRSLVGYHSWGLRCLPSVSHSTRCSIRSFMCPTVHLTHCTVLLSFSFIKMVNSLELISLNTVCTGSIHVVVNVRISFFLWLNSLSLWVCLCVCMVHFLNVFIHQWMNSHVLAIVGNVAENMEVKLSL